MTRPASTVASLMAALVVLAGVCSGCVPPPFHTSPSASYTVTVEAGSHDRRHTVVSFPMPDGMGTGPHRLAAEEGPSVPIQMDDRGVAHFVVDTLAAGARRTYRLRPAGRETVAGTRAWHGDGAVTVGTDTTPVLQYRVEPNLPVRSGLDSVYQRAGYIHPVYTPSGRVVTDAFPPNHPHHYGIWSSWSQTAYEERRPNFWEVAERTGRVEAAHVQAVWSGPVYGGLRAHHHFIDLTGASPERALEERWEVRVYRTGDPLIHVFDLTVRQDVQDAPLRLLKHRYGGIGVRGHRQWNGPDSAFFRTAGGRDRSDGHATRARWCHMGGYVDGRLAGLAVLGHPQNVRAPQPMRIHPTMPFFNFAPVQHGPLTITKNETFTARYRFVVYDGAPDAELLDRLWRDYAHPPEVTVAAASQTDAAAS